MVKRPWYIWLSFIAFGIISYRCRTKILHKKRDYNLWARYIGAELLWGIIILIIPAGMIVLFMHIASKCSYILKFTINILGLIYLYFGGVIYSAKLYDWELKNVAGN